MSIRRRNKIKASRSVTASAHQSRRAPSASRAKRSASANASAVSPVEDSASNKSSVPLSGRTQTTRPLTGRQKRFSSKLKIDNGEQAVLCLGDFSQRQVSFPTLVLQL